MAARTQSRDDLLTQRRPEARDDWIRVQNKNAHRVLHLYVLTASGLSSVRRTTATSDPANRFPNWPLTSLAE
jgi:hypothetical protein